MEVSVEKLNKIKTLQPKGWKYEEYKALTKIDFEGKKYKNFISFLFQSILCFIFCFIYILIRKEDDSSWIGVFLFIFLIGLVFPISWIPTLILSDEFYTKIYQYFSHKTKDYLRLANLKAYFQHIENQIQKVERELEVEAVLILSKVEVEAQKRIEENNLISNKLGLKRKWNECYLKDLEIVKNNCQLNRKTIEVFGKNIEFIKFDKEKRKHFDKFHNNLKYSLSLVEWSERKINSLYGQPSQSTQSQSVTNVKRLESISNSRPSHKKVETESNINTSGNTAAENIKQQINTQQSGDKLTSNEILGKKVERNSEIKKTQETEDTELFPNGVSKTFDEPIRKFPSIGLKSSRDIPIKRKTPKFESIIKASSDFYKNLASKKIEIGMKGELLVMEHERQRLVEEGENPNIVLIHKSVTDGDGFGYDILSLKNGEEIYIEVKTTTGSFWSNLFFSQNEYNKMNELGEQYYLYRICNLDLETNKGDLFIFGGKEMIDSFFDFKSKMYVLTQKSTSV